VGNDNGRPLVCVRNRCKKWVSRPCLTKRQGRELEKIALQNALKHAFEKRFSRTGHGPLPSADPLQAPPHPRHIHTALPTRRFGAWPSFQTSLWPASFQSCYMLLSGGVSGQLTLAKSAMTITVPHQLIWSWYGGRWWVDCYIRYSEEGTGRGPSPPRPLLAVSNVTVHPSTASEPITVLLYNGQLLCGFNMPIKG